MTDKQAGKADANAAKHLKIYPAWYARIETLPDATTCGQLRELFMYGRDPGYIIDDASMFKQEYVKAGLRVMYNKASIYMTECMPPEELKIARRIMAIVNGEENESNE